ncbi:MAG: NnrS family protein [Betaproteobacteria bacterium]|nr:NnrS family protein [Betaproteobacteria bacterium]
MSAPQPLLMPMTGAQPSSAPSVPPGWRWRRLLDAPHRLCFFAAAVMMALVAIGWLLALAARITPSWAFAWQVSPSLAHGALMIHGFMPLFMMGFLFTAGPRWLGVPAPAARQIVGHVAALVVGWLLFAVGALVSSTLAAAAAGAAALAWLAVSLRFWALRRMSTAEDRVHATIVGLACFVGAAAQAALGVAVALHLDGVAQAALAIGLWGFAGVVYVAVVHRMIPFFTAGVVPFFDRWQPLWLLGLLVAAMLLQALLAVWQALVWPPPAALHALAIAADVPLAALLLWLAVRWGLMQSLRIRLLAMLHLGFVWLGLSFALDAAAHAAQWASDDTLSWALAPLHAFAMGFLGSLLIAMASRVSCGHSGRSLVADDLVWSLFWLLQAAVLVRVAAVLWPAHAALLDVLAAAIWAICMVTWALRYGNWYGRARADGRPG